MGESKTDYNRRFLFEVKLPPSTNFNWQYELRSTLKNLFSFISVTADICYIKILAIAYYK